MSEECLETTFYFAVKCQDDDDDPADSEVSGDEDGGEDDGEDDGGDAVEDDEQDDEDEDEDEEDPEDPQDILREKCGDLSRCVALKSIFDSCESRVNGRQKTEENCAQELLDFVGCVDGCVSI